MCTNDAPLSRPTTTPNFASKEPTGELPRIVEKIAYDLTFTDELIRRCRLRATQGYRLAATTVGANKAEVLLVFEAIEWNGVKFPGKSEVQEAGE